MEFYQFSSVTAYLYGSFFVCIFSNILTYINVSFLIVTHTYMCDFANGKTNTDVLIHQRKGWAISQQQFSIKEYREITRVKGQTCGRS